MAEPEKAQVALGLTGEGQVKLPKKHVRTPAKQPLSLSNITHCLKMNQEFQRENQNIEALKEKYIKVYKYPQCQEQFLEWNILKVLTMQESLNAKTKHPEIKRLKRQAKHGGKNICDTYIANN